MRLKKKKWQPHFKTELHTFEHTKAYTKIIFTKGKVGEVTISIKNHNAIDINLKMNKRVGL